MRIRIILASLASSVAVAFTWPSGQLAAQTAPAPAAAQTQPAAATQPATAPADLAQQVRGDWRFRAGRQRATYRFADDGTFSLSLAGPQGAGRITGRWRIDGRTLVMENLSTPEAVAPTAERQTVEVTEAAAETLTLAGKDSRGRDHSLVLRRALPFAPGRRDDPKVVGSWRAAGGRGVLILADDGTAVIGGGAAEPDTGHWSQAGRNLVIRAGGAAASGGRGPDTRPAQTQPAASAGTQPSTRPAEPAAAADVDPEEAVFQIVTLDDVTLSLRLDGEGGRRDGGRVQVFERMTPPRDPATQPVAAPAAQPVAQAQPPTQPAAQPAPAPAPAPSGTQWESQRRPSMTRPSY